MSPRVRPVAAWAVDLVLLVVFVLIGRVTHGAEPSGFAVTLLPFLAGLQTGWLLRSGQPPLALLRSGTLVWLATFVLGMLLRAATGQGTAPAFVVVAALTLGVFFLGWRALALLVTGWWRRRRAATRNRAAHI